MKPGPKPKDRTGATPGTRTCITCAKDKPTDLFYRSPSRPDGFYPECKACANERRRAGYVARGGKSTAQKEAGRRYNLSIRLAAIETYGGKCACCGESTFEFLTIDHVRNDGRDHRKRCGGTKGVFQWLKKNGYPTEPPLQVLCYNCHMSRTFLGYCPHVR